MKHLKKKSRRKLVGKIGLLLLFLVGSLIALYPFYVNTLNDWLDQQRISHYNQELVKKQAALDAKRKENAKLAETGISPGSDPFTDDITGGISEEYYQEHLIGRVMIPKLDLVTPLFDTTNDRLLNYGATVLQGTSFPAGGADTHSVVSAHSGLHDRELFTRLGQLKEKDLFVIEVYGEKMAYEVFEITTVLPNETESLVIRPGEDLVTLLTCTPYMINSHRLLVTGKRVPYTETVQEAVKTGQAKRQQKNLFISLGTLLLILILLYLLYRSIKAFVLWKRRGDLVFWRESANPQTNQYALFNRRGKKPIRRNGVPVTAKADQQGKVVFEDLPGSLFVLKEDNPNSDVAVLVGIKKWRQHSPRFFPKKSQKERFINGEKLIICDE
ncbi:class C sortase [Enterococcus sp.]|uniref:class C sortase n=1 Tax=Enterococcus sp. TaxID=35783 RepID=UPI003C79694F